MALDALRKFTGRARHRQDRCAAKARSRRRARTGRWLTAMALGPVVAAGTSLVPVAVTAGLAAGITVASAVVASAPAQASVSGTVLVVLVNGETSAPETALLQAAGYTVVTATPATLAAMSQSTFKGYAAVVIGDSSSGGTCSTTAPSTASLGSQWQPWVTGNVAVLGTAPGLAKSLAGSGNTGASSLITGAVEYAAAGYASSNQAGTGLYVSLNCAYASSPAGTAVPFLNGIEGIPAGAVTVQGSMSCTDSGTVNSWQADAAGTFAGYTSSQLAAGSTGSWPSPGCPVQEAFDSWPAMFTPFAYDPVSNPGVTANFTASDGITGQPYILMGQAASATTVALAPSAGGEVPAGATTGGAGNAAAAGVSQPLAAGSVNTENGDLTQSATDLSVPTFGPSLSFSRTYDSKLAQQQTQAGAPGPLGYGWTGNWASSLTTATPVPGDLYTLDGLQTNVNNGGAATSQPLNNPAAVTFYGSGPDTYIADTQGNRVEEVAGANETEWGITMTAGDMYTIVGSPTGTAGYSGNGATIGANGTSRLDKPDGVAINSTGLFISDACRIVEIPSSGANANTVQDYAGTSTCGVGADNVAATSSDLGGPGEIHFGFGSEVNDLYIADTGNNRIQEVAGANETEWGQTMTAGRVYTVAGSSTGRTGYSSNGTRATSALLNAPAGLTVAGGNYLYIADTQNCAIEEVPPTTGSSQWNGDLGTMTANDIYTIAGQGPGHCGDTGHNIEAIQATIDYPAAIAFDSSYGLYIAGGSPSNQIREVAAVTGTQYGQSMTNGDIYGIAGSGSQSGDSGDGGPAASALMANPSGVAVDGGSVFTADTGNNETRRVWPTSPYDITDVAGGVGSFYQDGNGGATDLAGEPAYDAGLNSPYGVASDSHGDTFVADEGGNRVQEIAAWNHAQFGISMTAGQVYTVAGAQNGYQVCEPQAITTAQLCQPTGVAVDGSGNLYVVDSFNSRVLKVNGSTGAVSLFAGNSAGTPWSSGKADTGVAATSAYLDFPYAIATDAAGDVFIAGNASDVVQEIPAASGTHYGISMTGGDIYIIAGTPGTAGAAGDGGKATSADLNGPQGVALDPAGDVYIGDYMNNRIQEVAAATHVQWGQSMTASDIYTIAGLASGGSGAQGYSGDGGPATAAKLAAPGQIATDAAGDLYITDAGNNRIREVAAASGTQWSQQMTGGDIYTVAGNGTAGPWGAQDGLGQPATSALLDAPLGIGVDPAGDLYITNSMSNYLDEVTATSTPAFPVYPAAATLTVTQPGGAQVTFNPQVSGACPAPQVPTGSYCVLPQDAGATLTSSSGVSYTFSPSPGGGTYTYSWAGQLTSQTDSAGNTLTINDNYPAPGQATSTTTAPVTTTAITCPAAAVSCQTIISASGRALVLGYNAAQDGGLVTSVTDPMNRTWTYGYTGSDLTSVTDPMPNITSYTYGAGSGNTSPLLANDLLTITKPNAQPGGPDAGDSTSITYNNAGQVTSQTDPMGWKTTLSYCVNAAAGDCFNSATGNGFVTVTDPDGNNTVYYYDQGTLAAQTAWTGAVGATLTSQAISVPDTTIPAVQDGNCPGNTDGSLLKVAALDGNSDQTTYCNNALGNVTSTVSPSGGSTATGTVNTTAGFTAVTGSQGGQQNCAATGEAAVTCPQDPGPSPVQAGQAISPPSSAPPLGLTWTLYDNLGNQLYSTTGVYSPSGTYEYSQTTYQLFNGNSVTLPGTGTAISCTNTAPSPALPCATINADGVATQLHYNSQGDLTLSSTPDGNGSELANTTYTYDSDGEQLTKVAPDGNVAGANVGNYTTTTAWNNDHQQTSATDGGGTGYTDTPRITNYGYDSNGNQTTVKDARGFTTTTTYNADDKPALVTDPDNNATLTCYDGAGNTAQTIPPIGVAANGLTLSSCPASYPAGYNNRLALDASVSTFNALGQQTQQTTPAPAGQSGYETTSFTYDGNGNILTTTAPPATNGGQNQVTVDRYNTAGMLSSVTTGSGTSAPSTVSYCYDPNGNRTSVVYADGNTSGVGACETSSPWVISATSYPTPAAYQTTYSYDSAEERVSTTTPATSAAPSGANTTSTYDANGNMLTSTDPMGVITSKTYTPLGKVATVNYSGSSAHSVTYGYDAGGNKTSVTDATGTSAKVYDSFGELTSAQNGAGQTTQYGYTADGQVSSITYPLPGTASWATTNTVSYGYDNADRLTSATDFSGQQVTIANTADGLPNSQVLGTTGDTLTANYDSIDRPSAIALKNSGTALQSLTYSDSPAGTILTETDTPTSPQAPVAYTYDGEDRVTSMTPGIGSSLSYGFDTSGNLTTLPTGATGTYDKSSELSSSVLSGTTTNYTYNPGGQRLTATQGSTVVASGTWNGAGQPTAYSDVAANMTAAAYDANGLRASSTITPAGQMGISANYVWNTVPAIPQMIMDSGNAYIYATGPTPVEQVNLVTGSVTYLVTDSLGSVRGTVNSSGSLTGTANYDAWGNPETQGGLSATTPFGYAGGYTDATGLIYLINRYYDPMAGQFISLDPQMSATDQAYSYAGDNPVSAVDPNGLMPVPSGGGCWTIRCQTDYWEFQTSLWQFQAERNYVCGWEVHLTFSNARNCYSHGNTQGRALDWQSDGCSPYPVTPNNWTFGGWYPWQGSKTAHFWKACERHDFGYHNYKEQHRWTAAAKFHIDNHFWHDINYYICDPMGVPYSWECHPVAEVYYVFVSELGT